MKIILTIYNWLRKEIKLPSAFSWQTLIVLSIFSFYMGLLASGWLKNLLANFCWIFLILGVYWGTTATTQFWIGYKNPAQPGFPISPWITGVLVSIYLFGFIGNQNGEFSREMLIYWPIISAILFLIPDYWGSGFKLNIPPPERRKNQVLIFSSQILLSCWFQFHFLIQDYVAQYPSVVADQFTKSAFVVKWQTPLASPTPRGASILIAMEPELRQQLDGRSWPVVEKLLLPQERKKLIDATVTEAKKRISSDQVEDEQILEDGLWIVASNVSQQGSGYNLVLQAIWQGPNSGNQPSYTVTKTCKITQIPRSANAENKPVNTPQASLSSTLSRINCQPIKGWGEDKPIIALDG